MQTAHEFFVHELSDMLDAERKIMEALSGQSEESSNPKLQSAFHSHRKQTQGQIERLEQCFELLEEAAQDTECAGIEGLRKEHETMKGEDPSPDILDVFNVAAAIKVERYEISAYESLIRLAELMKHTKLVRLLKQNLLEEEQTLKKMTSFAAKLKPENLDLNGKEQEEQNSGRNEVVQQNRRTGPQMVKKSGPQRKKAA